MFKNSFYQKKLILFSIVVQLFISCSKDDNETINNPVQDVFYLPVVVHVINKGEAMGVGTNLSTERIERQIQILNEDFRKKNGTRGYNEHPDGTDSKIEFVLAKHDPNGNPINGINRINMHDESVPNLGYNQNNYAQYAYWNPNDYINVWTTPLPESSQCLVFGISTGPDTDLPGTEHLSIPEENDAEGILINWMHFGESNIDCHARFGRTLTHEMGHYLGLLHTWGAGDCEYNDYCEDTPAVSSEVFGRVTYNGCQGEQVMIGNYMNYSDDDVMNIFTDDQVARMHYVLQHHSGRNSLLKSHALKGTYNK